MRELVFQKLKLKPSLKDDVIFSLSNNNRLAIFGKNENKSFVTRKLLSLNVSSFSSTLFFVERVFSFRSALNYLLSQAYNVLKGWNQMFFFEFRIIGLGYKIFKFRRSVDLKLIYLKLGYSHLIKYSVPKNVRIITGKRRLLLFSNNIEIINSICKHFFFLKKKNVYKYKGLLISKQEYKLKQGKKQQR